MIGCEVFGWFSFDFSWWVIAGVFACRIWFVLLLVSTVSSGALVV